MTNGHSSGFRNRFPCAFYIVLLKKMRHVINNGMALYIDDESFFALVQNDCETTEACFVRGRVVFLQPVYFRALTWMETNQLVMSEPVFLWVWVHLSLNCEDALPVWAAGTSFDESGCACQPDLRQKWSPPSCWAALSGTSGYPCDETDCWTGKSLKHLRKMQMVFKTCFAELFVPSSCWTNVQVVFLDKEWR